MEQLAANIAGKTRRETLGGRDYIVAPLSMIVPGVLAGSKGPLFYPLEELKRDPSAWNHMPIVVYHPTENGMPISARNPHVLDKHGIGFVFGAKAEDKLIAEGWFDVVQMEKVDKRVLEALEAGKQIELSTGLFTDNVPAAEGAAYNGKAYAFVAKNYKPDHLAILPDQKGACSLKDGCGVLVNIDEVGIRSLVRKEITRMAKKDLIDSIIANSTCWSEEDRPALEAMSDKRLEALKAGADKIAQERAVFNAAVAGFKDGDSEFVFNAETKKWDKKADPPKKEEPVANKEEPKAKPITIDDLPESMKAVVNRAIAKERKEKDALIAKVTANKRNTLTKEQLDAFGIEQLEAIAVLAEEPQASRPAANYQAAAGATGNARQDDDKDDVLPLPTINWAEDKKKE